MLTNFNNKYKFFYDGLFPDNTLTDCTCTDIKRSRKNNISLINKQYQTQIKPYSNLHNDISNSYNTGSEAEEIYCQEDEEQSENESSQYLNNNKELDNNDYSDVFINGFDDINGAYNDEILNNEININNNNKIIIIQDSNIITKEEKKEELGFDINKLNISKDSKWQDIPKKIFGINKDVDLDEYLLNIDLKTPVNSFLIFCREKNKYLNKKINQEKRNKMWNELNKDDKNKYTHKSQLTYKYHEKKKSIVNKYIFIYYDFIQKQALTPSKLFQNDSIIRKLDSTINLKDLKRKVKSYYTKNNNNVKQYYKLLNIKLNEFFHNIDNNKVYEEYIKDITSLNETNKKHEDIKPEYLFKEDLLSLNKNYNDKELNKLYNKLPSDIKKLYVKKAHRLTLISYFKWIQYNNINNNRKKKKSTKKEENKFVKKENILGDIFDKIKVKEESLDDDSDFNSTPKKQKVKIRKRYQSFKNIIYLYYLYYFTIYRFYNFKKSHYIQFYIDLLLYPRYILH